MKFILFQLTILFIFLSTNIILSGLDNNVHLFSIPPNDSPRSKLTRTIEFYVTADTKTEVTLEFLYDNAKPDKKIIKQITNEQGFTIFTDPEFENWEYRLYDTITTNVIKISAPIPIQVVAMSFKDMSSEGFLVLPVKNWGKKYIFVNYYEYTESYKYFDPDSNLINSYAHNRGAGFIIVSSEDNTNCEIILRGEDNNIPTNIITGGYKIGDTLNIILDAGESYMLKTDGDGIGNFDLSGSEINSDKPIGLISFNLRTKIPYETIGEGRDPLYEMLPPVKSWGKKHISTEYERKGKGDYFRIMSCEPNTEWSVKYYDKFNNDLIGEYTGILNNPGDYEALFEIDSVNIYSTKSIRGVSIWESNKPVLISQFAYSADFDDVLTFDPFMVIIPPLEQVIYNCSFQVPDGLLKLQNNYVSLIIHVDSTNPKNVLNSIYLDSISLLNIDSTIINNKIPTTDLYWANILITPGQHTITSDTKFNGHIYGFDHLNSYGYGLNSNLFSRIAILEANSYNWNKKRIDRPNFINDGPYKAPEHIIKLKNKGNKTLLIENINIISNDLGEVFGLDSIIKNIANISIEPDEFKIIPVEFHPTAVGDYELIFDYNSNSIRKDTTTLKGIGVVPIINTKNYYFGEMLINDYKTPLTELIEIENINWKYSDTLNIYDIKLSNYNKGFTFPKPQLNTLSVLLPGEKYYLNSEFIAKKLGLDTVIVNSFSDALYEFESYWSGKGINEDITHLTTCPIICVGDSKIFTYSIKNNGNKDINIKTIKIQDTTGIFTFLNSTDSLGFRLAPDSTQNIDIVFSPIEVGKTHSLLTIETDTKYDNIKHVILSGEGLYYNLTNILTVNNTEELYITDKVNCSIYSYLSSFYNNININKLNISINYNNELLKPITESILLSDELKPYFIIDDINIITIGNNNQLTITIEALENNSYISGQILELSFDTFLPTYNINNSDIKINITTDSINNCINIENYSDSIQMQPFCADDIRRVNISQHLYKLNSINPNPVETRDNIDISFTIGLDAWTKLQLYSLNGKVSNQLINKYLIEGDYNIIIDIQDFAAGTYFYSLTSGPFYSIKKFIIK